MCDNGGHNDDEYDDDEDYTDLSRQDESPLNQRVSESCPYDEDEPPDPNPNNPNNELDSLNRNYRDEVVGCCRSEILNQCVHHNFQLERDIDYARGALAGMRERCNQLGVPANQDPSITNLQSAYDSVMRPESVWNRFGTTYYDRAIARAASVNTHEEYREHHAELSNAIEQIQPLHGPDSGSLVSWRRVDVLDRDNIAPFRRDFEQGVGQVICREHAEQFLAAGAQNQRDIGERGFGRYPQNIVTHQWLNRAHANEVALGTPDLDPVLDALGAEMDNLQAGRAHIRNDVLTREPRHMIHPHFKETYSKRMYFEVCPGCTLDLDPAYEGYTTREEQDTNNAILEDPGRCRGNTAIAEQLLRAQYGRRRRRPLQGNPAPPNMDDLLDRVGRSAETLSDEEVVGRLLSGQVWNRPVTAPPNNRRYLRKNPHPPCCNCADDPNCGCAGCEADRDDRERWAMRRQERREAARAPPTRQSERLKRKRDAERGEERECEPGCNSPRHRDDQQGPSKRPPRGGASGGGAGAGSGGSGQGICA